MATFTFSAERQVVFHVVTADGRRLLVRFEERNSFGASNFSTTDAKVAAAIRKHTMTQRGVIRETTPPEEKKKKKAGTNAKVTPKPTPANPTEEGGQAPDAGGEAGGEQTPPENAGNGDNNVVIADNFTLAKEALVKRFGVEADAVKTPILMNKYCKDNGIELHIKRNR